MSIKIYLYKKQTLGSECAVTDLQWPPQCFRAAFLPHLTDDLQSGVGSAAAAAALQLLTFVWMHSPSVFAAFMWHVFAF